jgi:hypothetical protein
MSDAAEVINTVLTEDGRYIPKSIERDERTARGLVPKLMKLVGRIPFAEDLGAAYYAARDPKTPMRAKAVLFAAVAYFVTPIDMMPDFITGLGFTRLPSSFLPEEDQGNFFTLAQLPAR